MPKRNLSEPESIESVRDRLTDMTLILTAAFGLPATAASLARIPDIGWIPAMGLHIGAYAVIALMTIWRRYLPVSLKSGLIIVLIYIVGTGSFPSMATAGSGIFFYLASVVLATLLLGFWMGFGMLILCLASMIGAYIGMRWGIIEPTLDFNSYVLSTSSWVSKFAVFTLLSSLTLVLMTLMERWLNHSILQMKNEIRERKHTEEMLEDSLAEKDTLIKEVHHRVKSNLQVITSLLDAQSNRVKDSKTSRILRISRNRILVMSLIHEELYRSDDLSRVRFDTFLSGLLANLGDLYSHDSDRISIEAELEPAYLPMDTAIPCGLIINELVSNSLRHAFPGEMKGKIKVVFSQEGNENYLLSVSDDGIGLPEDFDRRKGGGLGIQVITSIADQLGAQFTQEKDRGTSFVMRFHEYEEAGSQMH
jgi:two-component sensor histidine kinase